MRVLSEKKEWLQMNLQCGWTHTHVRKITTVQLVAWNRKECCIFFTQKTYTNWETSGHLGDCDSKSHSAVANADPPIYESCPISKLECCGHVQKWIRRRLPEIVKRCKDTIYPLPGGKTCKGIGGVGKLTKKQILRMQGHYGAVIRNNVGNVPQMKEDIWAIQTWGAFNVWGLVSNEVWSRWPR